MHILTAEQFTKTQLEALFQHADTMQKLSRSLASRRRLAVKHQGRQLCSLFYEPSTRTRLSFEAAAVKLGLGVVSTENAREFSSAAKGEIIEDTIRTLSGYEFDVIVLRHHETGAAARAAAVSTAPVLNAGDGKGEHPTQALLDAYTIHRQFGSLDNLHIVMGGDLAHGRTVRSLAKLLSKYGKNNRISFVSVPELQIGDDIKELLQKHNTDFVETDDMHEALRYANVVYWTRLQKERLADPTIVSRNQFVLDNAALRVLSHNAIVMHPLPRVNEIAAAVDTDPRALYFEQAANGLYIRMALIDQLL